MPSKPRIKSSHPQKLPEDIFDSPRQSCLPSNFFSSFKPTSQQFNQQKMDSNSTVANNISYDRKTTTSYFYCRSQYAKSFIHKPCFTLIRKTSSLHKRPKPRSYSIDCSFNRQRRTKEDITHTSRNQATGLTKQQIAINFGTACLKLEQEYRQDCERGHFEKAYQRLVVLLNYTVDISSMGWFFKVLYTICEFYTILEEYETSLKLYNELREAAIMLKDYEYLVASLIGIAKCAGHANLTSEAVTILKKALEYAWYVRSVELEINIYDELGEKYYKLGDLEKANIFHMKYANAIMEEDGSPLRKLSRKQISIVEEANTAQKYENVSQSFLAHLTLPIKNTEELFPLIPTLITARENMPEPRMIKTVSEMGCSNGIETQIRRILKHWMFEIEGQEPNLDEAKMIENEKKNTFNARKFIFIDFKMNQHLKEKGIRLNPSPNLALPTHVQSKELGWEAAWNGVKKKTYSGFRTYQKDRHPNKFKHKQQILKSLFRKIIVFMNKKQIM